jgi:hypothetical protein
MEGGGRDGGAVHGRISAFMQREYFETGEDAPNNNDSEKHSKASNTNDSKKHSKAAGQTGSPAGADPIAASKDAGYFSPAHAALAGHAKHAEAAAGAPAPERPVSPVEIAAMDLSPRNHPTRKKEHVRHDDIFATSSEEEAVRGFGVEGAEVGRL